MNFFINISKFFFKIFFLYLRCYIYLLLHRLFLSMFVVLFCLYTIEEKAHSKPVVTKKDLFLIISVFSWKVFKTLFGSQAENWFYVILYHLFCDLTACQI